MKWRSYAKKEHADACYLLLGVNYAIHSRTYHFPGRFERLLHVATPATSRSPRVQPQRISVLWEPRTIECTNRKYIWHVGIKHSNLYKTKVERTAAPSWIFYCGRTDDKHLGRVRKDFFGKFTGLQVQRYYINSPVFYDLLFPLALNS